MRKHSLPGWRTSRHAGTLVAQRRRCGPRADHPAGASGHGLLELAGLPPITGLYTSILCLIAYAVFGPSKILVLGPDSSLGPMIAATLLPWSTRRRDRGRPCAGVGAGADGRGDHHGRRYRRLGFIADLISKPTIIGYMNGLFITILIGPLPKLFGFSVDRDGFIQAHGLRPGVTDGETVGAALAIGLFGLAVIVVAQRWMPCVPGCSPPWSCRSPSPRSSTWPTTACRSSGGYPRGSPPFTLPDVQLADLSVLIGGAFGIALVSLTDTISTASSFAARTGEKWVGSERDDRHRLGEPGGRSVPGVPRQHQRLADRGGGAGRRRPSSPG